MEKTARKRQIIKWQLILGSVVCAIVAFCALPNVVIAADVERKSPLELFEELYRKQNADGLDKVQSEYLSQKIAKIWEVIE